MQYCIMGLLGSFFIRDRKWKSPQSSLLICRFCRQQFLQRSVLQLHLEEHHTHSIEQKESGTEDNSNNSYFDNESTLCSDENLKSNPKSYCPSSNNEPESDMEAININTINNISNKKRKRKRKRNEMENCNAEPKSVEKAKKKESNHNSSQSSENNTNNLNCYCKPVNKKRKLSVHANENRNNGQNIFDNENMDTVENDKDETGSMNGKKHGNSKNKNKVSNNGRKQNILCSTCHMYDAMQNSNQCISCKNNNQCICSVCEVRLCYHEYIKWLGYQNITDTNNDKNNQKIVVCQNCFHCWKTFYFCKSIL